MTHRLQCDRVAGASAFRNMERQLAQKLYSTFPFDRGEVHAQKVTSPEMVTRELSHVSLMIKVPEYSPSTYSWAELIDPNLPWAEEHFQERVSGQPLNPPPSHVRWPFNRAGNDEHLVGGKFSHTYPERFWPRFSGDYWCHPGGMTGVRFQYGDLSNVLDVLQNNIRSRQAYLPVWFPEDLRAATEGERVPCTLGYHFLLNDQEDLDMVYYMRSCDFFRFFRDDIYMAGRLLQWVVENLMAPPDTSIGCGDLIMYISSLHAFEGDVPRLKDMGWPLGRDFDDDDYLSGITG